MFASIISPESDSLNKSWAEFSKCTGITIAYEGCNHFESQLPMRVAGRQRARHRVHPAARSAAEDGRRPARSSAAPAGGRRTTSTSTGTRRGRPTAPSTARSTRAPMSSNMKSFVWYSPKVFTADGLHRPHHVGRADEAVSDKMVADGSASRGAAASSPARATGWPATDWLEQIVLRQSGRRRLRQVGQPRGQVRLARDHRGDGHAGRLDEEPDYVNAGFGDVKTIATTTFQDAGKPILDRQVRRCSSRRRSTRRSGRQGHDGRGQDGDVFAFYLPPIEHAVRQPGRGWRRVRHRVLATVPRSRPSRPTCRPRVRDQPGQGRDGWVSANNGVSTDAYTDPIDQLSAKYLTDPTATFRFDASDLMPAAVGCGCGVDAR